MLYATSVGSYTVRFHLRLDRKIDAAKMSFLYNPNWPVREAVN